MPAPRRIPRPSSQLCSLPRLVHPRTPPTTAATEPCISPPPLVLDARRVAQDKLASPTQISRKTLRLRNGGCLKPRAPSQTEMHHKFQCDSPPVVLDELRACQNCDLKFYTNKSTHETNSFFCCDDCMWTAIMTGASSHNQQP